MQFIKKVIRVIIPILFFDTIAIALFYLGYKAFLTTYWFDFTNLLAFAVEFCVEVLFAAAVIGGGLLLWSGAEKVWNWGCILTKIV